MPDIAGNIGSASRTSALDQDLAPEPPSLAIANTSPTVPAGGSIDLGITVTPADSDDKLSLKVAGVPGYETITAPPSDTVNSTLKSDGTTTYTITAPKGQTIGGLTLTSTYSGSGSPTSTFTVTATNKGASDTPAFASQTMTVTDPPIVGFGDSGPQTFGETVGVQDPAWLASAHHDTLGYQGAASASPLAANASHFANSALLTNYIASSFAMDGGGHGGLLFANPPANALHQFAANSATHG